MHSPAGNHPAARDSLPFLRSRLNTICMYLASLNLHASFPSAEFSKKQALQSDRPSCCPTAGLAASFCAVSVST